MFKLDIQDGGHGSHFEFCIGTIFIIFYLQVALIFPTKFRVSWPLNSREVVQNRFLRVQKWQPSWISDWNNFSNFWLTSHPNSSTKFRAKWHLGSGEEVQNIFSRWWPSLTSDWKSFSYFLICRSPWYFLASFSSIGLSVQEKKFKKDFQDGHDGGHFRFPIKMISAISDLQVNALILPTKF